MASTAITGELIWPSQNDLYGSGVSGAAGDGKKFLEVQMSKLWPQLAGRNALLTTNCLPASDADLTMPIGAGSAIIDGFYVQWPATNITFPASNTSHVFVKLVRGGGLVTGAEIEDNTSGTQPASSVKLGTVVTSGSAVTSTTMDRAPIGMAYNPLKGPGAAISGSTRSHEGTVVIAGNQNLSGVHFYHDFTLNNGVTVTVPAGKRRLVIVATGTITINGTINAAGAGAPAGQPGTDQPGGGGGAGGGGGDAGTDGGDVLLNGISVQDGGAGAAGSNGNGSAGTQLTGSDLPLVAHFLLAFGGAGGGTGFGPQAGGPGGGSIILIAPRIVLAATAVLNTSGSAGNGGGGGTGGGGGGGAGNIYLAAHDYSDAGATFTQTAGAGGAGGGNGAGGNGAAGVKQIHLY